MRRYLLIIGWLLLTACAAPQQTGAPAPTPTPALPFEVLLPPNAIQVLDHPTTVPATEADAHVGPLEDVMGVAIGDEARAYPIGLMSRYEVANDTLGGQPIAVTFCPSCNTAVAFARTVQGAAAAPPELTFGVSGKLLDGAMVMVDQQTGTLWSQSRFQAVEGPLAGTPLDLIAGSQMPWQEWLAQHPNTTLVIDEAAPPAQASFEIPAIPAPGSAPNAASVTGYVVGVASDTLALAVPVAEIDAAGVINGEAEGVAPFLLVSLGEPGAFVVWERSHEGQTLTFTREGAQLKDAETGTLWDGRTGRAESGPLAGAQLAPFTVRLTHWRGWLDLYPKTTIWSG